MDARITDPYISRLHFTLEVGPSGIIIADASSKAGTRVSGVKISRRRLWHGDEIEIGGSSLRFESDQKSEAARWSFQSNSGGEKFLTNEGMETLVGKTMGHFKLDRIAHIGRTSGLFRGQDQRHSRPVMVKVIYPSITSDDAHRNRFVRAVQSVVDVRHPNLVEVYGAGKQGPYCWCAMELVDGASLRDIVNTVGKDGRMGWRDAYRVAVHVARVLEYAHHQNVIHRDVSPGNLIQRTDDGVVKLCDLMWAKSRGGASDEQLTAEGEVVGEVGYMSPEQLLRPSKVDWRSDQYGLGATIYALLTGNAPFEATTREERIRGVQQEIRPFPTEVQHDANNEFLSIVLRMLSKSPEARFASPQQMLDTLHQLGEQSGIRVPHTK